MIRGGPTAKVEGLGPAPPWGGLRSGPARGDNWARCAAHPRALRRPSRRRAGSDDRNPSRRRRRFRGSRSTCARRRGATEERSAGLFSNSAATQSCRARSSISILWRRELRTSAPVGMAIRVTLLVGFSCEDRDASTPSATAKHLRSGFASNGERDSGQANSPSAYGAQARQLPEASHDTKVRVSACRTRNRFGNGRLRRQLVRAQGLSTLSQTASRTARSARGQWEGGGRRLGNARAGLDLCRRLELDKAPKRSNAGSQAFFAGAALAFEQRPRGSPRLIDLRQHRVAEGAGGGDARFWAVSSPRPAPPAKRGGRSTARLGAAPERGAAWGGGEVEARGGRAGGPDQLLVCLRRAKNHGVTGGHFIGNNVTPAEGSVRSNGGRRSETRAGTMRGCGSTRTAPGSRRNGAAGRGRALQGRTSTGSL